MGMFKSPDIDPHKGVFRAAWPIGSERRSKYAGGIAATLATALVYGIILTSPPNPTASQTLVRVIVSIGFGASIVVFLSLIVALIAVPYLQRDVLIRRDPVQQAIHAQELAKVQQHADNEIAKVRRATVASERALADTIEVLTRQLEKANISPVDAKHAKYIQDIAVSLIESINAGRFSQFGDSLGSTNRQRSFVLHFPQIAEKLKAWDDVVYAIPRAETMLDLKLVNEVTEQGLKDPPFDCDQIVSQLREVFVLRKRNPWVPISPSFEWKRYSVVTDFDGTTTDYWYFHAFGNGGTIYCVLRPSDDLDRDEAHKEQIVQFLKSSQNWPEALAIPEAERVKNAMRAPILLLLEEVTTGVVYRGCHNCDPRLHPLPSDPD
jgi:hypothetical protein